MSARSQSLSLAAVLPLLALSPVRPDPGWIRLAPDGRGFVAGEPAAVFCPLGFNYDHDEQGRLIEDYWHDEWAKVEADFAEMRELGANLVRVHLQFAKFMEAPETAREPALRQLDRLVDLAARTGLRLDLTGLGCYHRADVPPWYDALTEEARWEAQARFWEAIARRCRDAPAVFCYDLMNEPVVPGGDKPRSDWLGPDFAGKHFVQFIALDRAGRERHAVARQWIEHLAGAIRRHDSRHLITVGLVPWSLDRPGLTSGFVPDRLGPMLDFLSVHLYPESGKLAEARETLRGFAAGKPVLVEEIFPLKCSPAELGQFMRESADAAAGWVGFYWGKTPDECRAGGTIADAITLGWLELFRQEVLRSPAFDAAPENRPESLQPRGASSHLENRESSSVPNSPAIP